MPLSGISSGPHVKSYPAVLMQAWMKSAISMLGDEPRKVLSGYVRFASISHAATCFLWSAMQPQSKNASVNAQPHFICIPARCDIANKQRILFRFIR